ncbi:hypothetical protein [Halobellus rubicundus]|uniref:Iron ABC transporter permease n=1 Tax=Halobellus rubicundus TaxID=2996466 RepID=A0ABD5MJT4_9EURY
MLKLLPWRLIAVAVLLVVAGTSLGIDLTGMALDFLGIPDWRWTGLDLLPW